MRKHFVITTIITLVIFGTVLGFSSNARAFDIRTSDENEVRVDVKPVILMAGRSAVFEVRLNTHSVDLNYDIVEVSILKDSDGKIYKAVEWKGSGPGGHHRRGTSKFPKLEGTPQSVKLVMRGIGGVTERSFEWEIMN